MFKHLLERNLALVCLGFPNAVNQAMQSRRPHELAAWAFDLAAEVS